MGRGLLSWSPHILVLTSCFRCAIAQVITDWGEIEVSRKGSHFEPLASLAKFFSNSMNHLKRRGFMIIKPSNLASSRRQFILNILPAGTLFCLGCGNLSAWTAGQEAQKPVEKKHKFQEDSGMSYEEVFSVPLKGMYIPLLQNLSQRLKGIDFIEMLKAVTYERAIESGRERAKMSPKNDFVTFTSGGKKRFSSPFWNHVMTYTFVEDTGKVLEWKFTECLFAKTFREANASDIGYATICYGDYGTVEGFNPKIRLTLTKTLMQGHDCCNHRYVWEG
jgi:hypothetical protein